MVALSLFDVVLSDDDKLERFPAVAEQMIQSALAELAQIRQLDKTLLPVKPEAPDRTTLTLVRGMYEEWARNSDALLNRVEQLQKRSGKISGWEELRDAHGRTCAMLSVTIEAMEEGRRDIAEGRIVSGEEVRRELRLKIQRLRAEGVSAS